MSRLVWLVFATLAVASGAAPGTTAASATAGTPAVAGTVAHAAQDEPDPDAGGADPEAGGRDPGLDESPPTEPEQGQPAEAEPSDGVAPSAPAGVAPEPQNAAEPAPVQAVPGAEPVTAWLIGARRRLALRFILARGLPVTVAHRGTGRLTVRLAVGAATARRLGLTRGRRRVVVGSTSFAVGVDGTRRVVVRVRPRFARRLHAATTNVRFAVSVRSA